MGKADQSPWLKPTDQVYYLAHKWPESGFKKILDLGSGLGRHSIYNYFDCVIAYHSYLMQIQKGSIKLLVK